MKGTLLGIGLMVMAAVMMGCTDSIVPCTEDVDCEWDWGWYDDDAGMSAEGWWDVSLTCTGPHPQDYCEELLSWLPPLDWLPFGLEEWIKLPDCEELYGDLPEDTGTCEVDYGWW
jgi:hypothetical protein